MRTALCPMCGSWFSFPAKGRPRKVCPQTDGTETTSPCERELERRRWNEPKRARAKVVKNWWLGLSHDDKALAGEWMKTCVPPKTYVSKHEWAMMNWPSIRP